MKNTKYKHKVVIILHKKLVAAGFSLRKTAQPEGCGYLQIEIVKD